MAQLLVRSSCKSVSVSALAGSNLPRSICILNSVVHCRILLRIKHFSAFCALKFSMLTNKFSFIQVLPSTSSSKFQYAFEDIKLDSVA